LPIESGSLVPWIRNSVSLLPWKKIERSGAERVLEPAIHFLQADRGAASTYPLENPAWPFDLRPTRATPFHSTPDVRRRCILYGTAAGLYEVQMREPVSITIVPGGSLVGFCTSAAVL